jgi:YcxB-like protein
MEIRYRYRIEDFEELCVFVDALNLRVHHLRQGYLGVGFLLFMLPFLAGGSFLQPEKNLLWTIPIGVLLVLSSRHNPRKWARRQYGKAIYDYDYTATITEAGITTSSPTVKTELQWAAFSGYHKTENVVALLYEKVMYVFPRRAFAPQEWEDFVVLVERMVQTGKSEFGKK